MAINLSVWEEIGVLDHPKRELNFCNGYLSLLYFWIVQTGKPDENWKPKACLVQNLDNGLKFFLQEIPAFRDLWFQRVIMECGDHDFQGLYLVWNPKMGSKVCKVHFLSLFSWKYDIFFILMYHFQASLRKIGKMIDKWHNLNYYLSGAVCACFRLSVCLSECLSAKEQTS